MNQGYSTVYVINIVFQGIFTLVWQIGLALGVGLLLVNVLGAPPWVYVPLIIIGVLTGFISMVRFILAAMNSLDRIESERRQKMTKTEESRHASKR